MEEWLAVTLWFPPNKRERDCKQRLYQWVSKIEKEENLKVSYLGGIFTNFSPQVQCHSHVILTGFNKQTGKSIKDIDGGRWRALWNELTGVPAFKAADIKKGENLTGWLKYIFTSNVNKADDWRTLYFNLNLLNRFTDIKEYLKRGTKK